MRTQVNRTTFGLTIAFGLALGTLAGAHATGSEITAATQCAKLQAPMKGHCEECLGRPRPHHFHVDAPPASRCQPDSPK
jgi:hypothetical protein